MLLLAYLQGQYPLFGLNNSYHPRPDGEFVKCLAQVLGTISGSGKITLVDRNAPPDTPPAVDLDLEKVLGKMPRKTFEFTRRAEHLQALDLSQVVNPAEALSRVLRLPSVCSKRFLTTKVDRCVTGSCTRFFSMAVFSTRQGRHQGVIIYLSCLQG